VECIFFYVKLTPVSRWTFVVSVHGFHCLCVGYFVSDSVDIVTCGQMCAMRDVLIHHISVCSVDHVILVHEQQILVIHKVKHHYIHCVKTWSSFVISSPRLQASEALAISHQRHSVFRLSVHPLAHDHIVYLWIWYCNLKTAYRSFTMFLT